MIVYIINGKTPSVQAAVDYVCDDEKTAKKFDQARLEYENSPDVQEDMTLEEYYLSCEDNINRAINYIANEDKIGGYISGYLCDPEFVEEQFRQTKEINLARVGKQLKDDKGNYFYHIIQSFPEELEIADDEVHRCGLELVERLGLYQAVVTSHIHPAIDEEGEVHGKCKHNHIIINSHMYHEFVDPNNPQKMKYNDCKETYAQLQLINDQIAIEHGLPIIVNEDKERHYSWYEAEAVNKGKSWKERVRIDVNNAMRTSYDFSSYLEAMAAAGYKIRLGKSKTHGEYITYTCPDESHKVRDYVLGKGYTKPELEAYWDMKRTINEDLLLNEATDKNKIESIIEQASDPIYIKFQKNVSARRKEKMRERNLNIRNTYTNYFPLSPRRATVGKAELSYFDPLQTYEVVNKKHQTITEVTGADILSYFNQIYNLEKEEANRKRAQQMDEYYSNPGFINSALKSPYKVRLWDNNGRKRTTVELIVILAVVTIHNENGKWEPKSDNSSKTQEAQKHPIYARRDWKIQNMIDTIRVAREEEVETPTQLDERLDAVGKETSKSKAEVRRLTAAKNRMDLLHEAIEGYYEVKDICEKIQAMPDGPQKVEMQQKYTEEIEEYKKHKSVMYRHKATAQEEINDFLERYEQIQIKLSQAEEQAEQNKEEYRRLSKLKYNLQLAQNKQYCYGPEFEEAEISPDRETKTERSDEREN